MDFLNNMPSQFNTVVLYILLIWGIAWKGLALWKSAKFSQRNWFIAILILNGLTMGILEIIYLFRFAKNKLKLKELKFWEKK